MRRRHRPGFLRVVDEVALSVMVGRFTDDLDGVLVRTDRAVGPEPIENTTEDFVRFDIERLVVIHVRLRHIVDDPDREVSFGGILIHFIETPLDHGRGEFLR